MARPGLLYGPWFLLNYTNLLQEHASAVRLWLQDK